MISQYELDCYMNMVPRLISKYCTVIHSVPEFMQGANVQLSSLYTPFSQLQNADKHRQLVHGTNREETYQYIKILRVCVCVCVCVCE